MNWIPWEVILKTGHASMDADHAEMVRLFNQLTDAINRKKGLSACCGVLDDIIECAVAHFKHEAELMARHRYPKAEQHNAEHTRLIRQAFSYKTKFETGLTGSHIELAHFPEDWMTHHVVTSDKMLADFLANLDPAHSHRTG